LASQSLTIPLVMLSQAEASWTNQRLRRWCDPSLTIFRSLFPCSIFIR